MAYLRKNEDRLKGKNVKQAIIAPLCSAVVLPGLGQILNRQFVKGILVMAGFTMVFMAILIKLLLDVSAVMTDIIGPDLAFGRQQWPLLVSGLRSRNLTILYALIAAAAALWAYSVFDAFLVGRRFQPPAEDGEA